MAFRKLAKAFVIAAEHSHMVGAIRKAARTARQALGGAGTRQSLTMER
jgi:hypothetical protein